MAKGKNKKVSRKDQKRRKNDKHTFAKKEWFQLISPAAVKKTQPIGWTCCKRPTGIERVQDFLKGRVAEMCYGDIVENAQDINKKIQIVVDEINGKSCATNFYGFELTRDVVMEKLKKRQSLIDIYQDVKTQDGAVLRIFIMVVTRRSPNQLKLNSYAKTSKIKLLRKKIHAELLQHASEVTSDALAHEIITDILNKNFEKLAQKVIPNCTLQCYKVKTVKRGAVDHKKLLSSINETQRQKENQENPEAQNLLSRQQE